MIQKFIASIIMFALLSTSIGNAYTLEDKVLVQDTLGEYSKYIPMLENALPKVSDEKLSQLQATLTPSLSDGDDDISNFVKYALISIDLEIQSRSALLPELEMNNEEKVMVQQEIMSLQENLEEEISGAFSSIVSTWMDASRYQEKGNFNVSLDMAFEDFMQFEGNLDILNYISETQVFDQTFTGDIEANYNTKVSGSYGGELDFSMDTSVDVIVKDGAIYIKFDDLSSQSQSSNKYFDLDITPFTEKLKELADDSRYLEIPAEDAMYYIQSLNYTDLTNGASTQIQKALNSPLLEVESKTELGYSLIPTKHFCDMGKEISGIFDPFSGKACSESQYQDMLEDFKDSNLEIMLSLGDTNTLSIALAEEGESMNMSLSWIQNNITDIQGTFLNTKSSYYGDRYVNFHFIPGTSFDYSMGDDSFDGAANLLMDRNGAIYEGGYSINAKDKFTSQGVYRNKTLSMTLSGQDRDSKISCGFEGPMKANFVNISGGCDIHSPEIEYQAPGVQDIRVDSKFSYDGRTGSNNLDFSINTKINTHNYFDFKLSNKGTRRSIGERKIIAPERTKNIDEFADEIYTEIYSDYDYNFGNDYEYVSNEYDDYTEDCYIYESGDTTCYKYYDDKVETCEYLVETDETNCETYEYGYKLIETETDEYSRTCYMYDNGDYTCYTYYDDKDETCYYTAETDELDCDTYEYDDYDDYYYEDAEEAVEEDAMDAIED